MSDDDNWLTDYEVWQRQDDYDRECEIAAQMAWDESQEASRGE